MKTTIQITGQINGNTYLKNCISTFESEVKQTNFYGYSITFPTRKAAYKALWEGYQRIRQEDPNDSGLNYVPKDRLYYDASKAEIIK